MFWDDPNNKEFGNLCDVICGNELIVITGAGVSVGLKTKEDPTKKLPNWKDLVTGIYETHKAIFSDEARSDFDTLMDGADISNEYIIESAEVLCREIGDEEFFKNVISATCLEDNSKSKVHELILSLQPKGIITFNYDKGHENADSSRIFRSMTYDNTNELISVLNEGFCQEFILKAHGCVDYPTSIVLHRASYRRILTENPTYRAFFEHALTRFNALFIGFGMKDPDFDDLLQTLEVTYQGKAREHIYIFRQDSKADDRQRADNAARAVLLRRRYGVTCLKIREFSEISELLTKAAATTGPKTEQIIDGCVELAADTSDAALAKALKSRRLGHEKLQKLNSKGREIVTKHLFNILNDGGNNINLRSEAAYSLGKLIPMQEVTANKLVAIIDNSPPLEVGVHCLISLESFLPDRDHLEAWISKLEKLQPKCKNIDEEIITVRKYGLPRALVYLEALIAKWNATLQAT